MKIQDENAVRAALRDEYAEAFPQGSEDVTADLPRRASDALRALRGRCREDVAGREARRR